MGHWGNRPGIAQPGEAEAHATEPSGHIPFTTAREPRESAAAIGGFEAQPTLAQPPNKFGETDHAESSKIAERAATHASRADTEPASEPRGRAAKSQQQN